MNPPTEEPKQSGWSYSTYRAALRKDGELFAIVTPNGSDALSPEDAKTLVDALEPKLLKVFYGQDTGLVSLSTGVLLACVDDGHYLATPSDIPSYTITDGDAETMFGEEHNWSDLIAHLRENYDWTNKNMP